MATCLEGICGVQGHGAPLPGDPSGSTLLSAVPAFGGIDVTWTLPETNPFAVAFTKLYRGLTDSFDSALHIADVAGGFFYDKQASSIQYYYWIRHIAVSGTESELIGPATAVAMPLIAQVIEALTGQIDSGLLATSLKNQLDQISILNSNLLNEITDRETGETTLAEAMAEVQAGMAAAHTFILDEQASRVSEHSALVEQINGVVATLGDDIASVVTTMSAQIDDITGTVNALWTAQVNVNGLVGGFGLSNDGATVEAGFDVDRFWIGRTSADKRKPFIVDDGVVYIDQAVIRELTFSKLRDGTGTLLVEDGKIKAEYLTVGELSADSIISGGLRGINVNAASHTTSGSFLTTAAADAATTLNVHNTADFPASGSAWIIDATNDRDLITYTGKTATTLTGCTGVLAHTINATIVPRSKGIVMDATTNELRSFGDRGDGVFEELASIGLTSFAGDVVIARLGTASSERVALLAQSNTSTAIQADTTSGIAAIIATANGDGSAIYAVNIGAGPGILSYSNGSGSGVEGAATTGNGGRFRGNATRAPLRLTNEVTTWPTDRISGQITFHIRTVPIDEFSSADILMPAYTDAAGNWRWFSDDVIAA